MTGMRALTCHGRMESVSFVYVRSGADSGNYAYLSGDGLVFELERLLRAPVPSEGSYIVKDTVQLPSGGKGEGKERTHFREATST
jgi:hypothetical protein